MGLPSRFGQQSVIRFWISIFATSLMDYIIISLQADCKLLGINTYIHIELLLCCARISFALQVRLNVDLWLNLNAPSPKSGPRLNGLAGNSTVPLANKSKMRTHARWWTMMNDETDLHLHTPSTTVRWTIALPVRHTMKLNWRKYECHGTDECHS